jgi:GIY-YIG catalytic domain
LVSRVRKFSDLYFVGDGTPLEVREETFNAMQSVINRNSPFTGYVVEMLRRIDYFESRNTFIHVCLPALPYIQDRIMPDVGYVYMIVSLKDPRVGYVGVTKCFKRRIMEHNSGVGGSVQTRAMRPWVPVVLITKFDDPTRNGMYGGDANKYWRERFESRWRVLNGCRDTKAINSVRMLKNGEQAYNEFKTSLPHLAWSKVANLTENGKT